jgi:protein-disulfide isomerase
MHHFVWRAAALLYCTVSFAQTTHKAASAKAPAAPAAATKSAFDKTTFEEYVRHLFIWGPQIQVKVSDPKPSKLAGFQEVSLVASAGQASQEETFYVSNDGKKIIRGVVYDVNVNPFEADQARIATDQQATLGSASAPVVVVIYSDFQCSYCREEAKVVRETLVSAYPTQVRVHFKDFPLEQIHPWAKPAAIAGRCVYREKPDAFWTFHDWIFENQAQITVENLKEKVLEFAKTSGLDSTRIASCIDTKLTEPEVNRAMAEGRQLGVNSTPTLFVNGRKLVGKLAWPQLKAIIDHEIEYQKTHSSQKCCEVTLPSPLK